MTMVPTHWSGNIGPAHISRAAYLRIKRISDLIFVLLILPASALLIAVAAAAIALTMGRPIFFLSDRVGRDGRVFKMVKLRTMVPNAGAARNATLPGDPRITPLGRLLRLTHIDELPQVWNILIGDMTLVGPRPEQPHLVEHYRKHIPNYDLRHTVTPGLSGWSQVCFGYAADVTETTQKLTYDLEYIDRFGPRIDLIILWKTLQVYLNPNFVR